ncbi:MAG: flagellar export protein FliJ [Aquabacterium sp.]
MSAHTTTHSLAQLATLRQRELDELSSEAATQQQVRQRHLDTLQRIHSLYEGSGASGGATSPVSSLNCANYKQSVLQMAQRQQDDLARHEAQMATVQQALQAAAVKCEVLTQLIDRQRDAAATAERRAEQKVQDDMGAQLWWRTRT